MPRIGTFGPRNYFKEVLNSAAQLLNISIGYTTYVVP